MAHRRVHLDREFGHRLKVAMAGAQVRPSELAALEEVDAGTVSRWRRGERPDDLRFPRLARHLRVRTNWLKTGLGPMGGMEEQPEEGIGDYGAQRAPGSELEELQRDPDYEPEGSGLNFGLGTDLTAEDVIHMLLYNRAAFTRYLQTQFDTPTPLPVAAKLGFLDHVERIARDHGVHIPRDFLDQTRAYIRIGGL